jgi:phage-related protein
MSIHPEQSRAKPLKWVGSSKDDLIAFPDAVRKEMGHALYLAQIGMKSPKARPLRGFGGAGVLEVVDDHDGDTYRAVYTVKFRGIVYVLHAFQKKSRKGVETARSDIELIKARLRMAHDAYQTLYGSANP